MGKFFGEKFLGKNTEEVFLGKWTHRILASPPRFETLSDGLCRNTSFPRPIFKDLRAAESGDTAIGAHIPTLFSIGRPFAIIW